MACPSSFVDQQWIDSIRICKLKLWENIYMSIRIHWNWNTVQYQFFVRNIFSHSRIDRFVWNSGHDPALLFATKLCWLAIPGAVNKETVHLWFLCLPSAPWCIVVGSIMFSRKIEFSALVVHILKWYDTASSVYFQFCFVWACAITWQIYTYPVQNECMRWNNGTQAKPLGFQRHFSRSVACRVPPFSAPDLPRGPDYDQRDTGRGKRQWNMTNWIHHGKWLWLKGSTS